MAWARSKTIRWMIVFAIAFGGLVTGVIVVDIMAAQSGESATISHVIRMVWVNEPWTILLVTNLVAYLQGFFTAHFVAAGKATYQAIREESNGVRVLVASEDHAVEQFEERLAQKRIAESRPRR
jgi:hypothetical protein